MILCCRRFVADYSLGIPHIHRYGLRAVSAVPKCNACCAHCDPPPSRASLIVSPSLPSRALPGLPCTPFPRRACHAIHIQGLPLQSTFAHIDHAFQNKHRASPWPVANTVLARAGLGDDARLAPCAWPKDLPMALLILCAPGEADPSVSRYIFAPPNSRVSRSANTTAWASANSRR